jgi:hypothetical protein
LFSNCAVQLTGDSASQALGNEPPVLLADPNPALALLTPPGDGLRMGVCTANQMVHSFFSAETTRSEWRKR